MGNRRQHGASRDEGSISAQLTHAPRRCVPCGIFLVFPPEQKAHKAYSFSYQKAVAYVILRKQPPLLPLWTRRSILWKKKTGTLITIAQQLKAVDSGMDYSCTAEKLLLRVKLGYGMGPFSEGALIISSISFTPIFRDRGWHQPRNGGHLSSHRLLIPKIGLLHFSPYIMKGLYGSKFGTVWPFHIFACYCWGYKMF